MTNSQQLYDLQINLNPAPTIRAHIVFSRRLRAPAPQTSATPGSVKKPWHGPTPCDPAGRPRDQLSGRNKTGNEISRPQFGTWYETSKTKSFSTGGMQKANMTPHKSILVRLKLKTYTMPLVRSGSDKHFETVFSFETGSVKLAGLSTSFLFTPAYQVWTNQKTTLSTWSPLFSHTVQSQSTLGQVNIYVSVCLFNFQMFSISRFQLPGAWCHVLRPPAG